MTHPCNYRITRYIYEIIVTLICTSHNNDIESHKHKLNLKMHYTTCTNFCVNVTCNEQTTILFLCRKFTSTFMVANCHIWIAHCHIENFNSFWVSAMTKKNKQTLKTKTKRKTSDSVLWKSPNTNRKVQKGKWHHKKPPPKTSITQRLLTDLTVSWSKDSHSTGVIKQA